MSKVLHIGVDPATEFLGLCVIDQDGNALKPIAVGGETLYGYRTFKASGRTPFIRLDKLREALANYFLVELGDYLKAIGCADYTIASYTVENPAMGSYIAEHKNRYDTQLALGMAMYMCYEVYRDHLAGSSNMIQFHESKPGESSVAVGVGNRASKKQRNFRCAEITGGKFIEAENKTKGADGFVVGGQLHGANPDALDAYAAACRGRTLYIENKLLELAKQQEREQRKCSTSKKAQRVKPS